MRLIKWLVVFAVAFCASWIIIVTFSQPEFHTPVAAHILMHTTPKIPVYYYVAGAFCLGLLVGLLVALWVFVTQTAKNIKKSNELRSLQKEFDQGAASSSFGAPTSAAGSQGDGK